MPEASDLLARLIPEPIRSESFLPARQDLRIAALTGVTFAARAWHRLRYPFAVLWLVAQCRRMAGPHPFHLTSGDLMSFLTAVRHSIRQLWQQPVFTTVAALTLALGVGANVAVFAVVEATLLRPLGYPTDDRLVVLRHRDLRTGQTKPNIAIADYLDFKTQASAFEHLVSFGRQEATLFGPTEPVRVDLLSGSAGLFESLGTTPTLGRLLTADDGKQGTQPVAVLGHQVWTTVFGSDAGVIGRRVRIGQTEREIVGVAAPGFRFPPIAAREAGAIVPIALPAAPPANRRAGWPTVMGLLKPGVSLETANAQLKDLAEHFERTYPADNEGIRYEALALRDMLIGDTKRPLILLVGAVALVLLIACANVGNLLMARAVGRRSEMALRVALGAGRGRLLVQQFAESLVLVGVGAIAGLAAAHWGVPALVALVPASVTAPGLSNVGINLTVLSFAVGLSLLTAVAFSLISAWTAASDRRADGLLTPGRVTSSVAARQAAGLFVMAEIGLAVILIVGAGLIVRSFGNLISTDPGFDTRNVLMVNVALPPSAAYSTPDGRAGFFRRVSATVRALPGVVHAGAGVVTPLTGNNWTVPLDRADRPVPVGQKPPDVGWQNASGGFFTALGIPLRDGRLFDGRESPSSPPVVIVSEAIAREYFAGERAVGRRVRLGEVEAEIVGVVGDIRRASLTDQPRADMYMPFERTPGGSITLFIKTAGDPLSLATSVRETLKQLERQIVVSGITTMDETASESIASTSFAMWLMGLFATIALALAGIGVYGVMSYSVRQRTRELGTRIALGATSRDLVWLVVRHGLTTTAVGLTLGLVGAWAAGRAAQSLLHDVTAFDPLTIGSAVGVITLTSLLACYIPAIRASRVDAARTLVSSQ